MLENESVLQFANRIPQLAATLKSMKVSISESEMAMALLNGLPEEYNALISALDAIDEDETKLNFEFIKSRIIQEEQRIKMRTKSAQKRLRLPLYWLRNRIRMVGGRDVVHIAIIADIWAMLSQNVGLSSHILIRVTRTTLIQSLHWLQIMVLKIQLSVFWPSKRTHVNLRIPKNGSSTRVAVTTWLSINLRSHLISLVIPHPWN